MKPIGAVDQIKSKTMPRGNIAGNDEVVIRIISAVPVHQAGGWSKGSIEMREDCRQDDDDLKRKLELAVHR